MKGKQYTIRAAPEKRDAVLREEAAATGKSLNTLLIDILILEMQQVSTTLLSAPNSNAKAP